MPEAPEKADRQIWGAAVKALRLRSGRTIAAAAMAYEPAGFTPGDPNKGISVQRWQSIEGGNAKFGEIQRRALVKALGSTLEDLELERARISGHRRPPRATSLAEPEGRGFEIPVWGRTEFGAEGWTIKSAEVVEATFDLRDLAGPSIGVTYMPDDTMAPKVRSGRPVIFDRGRKPDKDEGCVIETQAGELYVRLYMGDDAEHVMVRSLAKPTPAAFRRAEIKGVYAVRFWGD
jgi:hypothetical protein